MPEQEMRYELQNRYHFKGCLVMKTALHIGGGRFTLSHSNSPVVLTPAGTPFIPGSSFKGALRSTVEKLIPGLPGLATCALIDLPENAYSVERPAKDKRPQWPTGVCPTVWQSGLTRMRRGATREQEAEILQEALAQRCHTCRLFGSPFAASRINISDLYMADSEWPGGLQVRDGVAIDRDSEKAKDRLKYDFEVVPASAEFALSIVLENATIQDLQLISIGLSEFVQGFGALGGKRSRGLGVCELRDLKVSSLELSGSGVSDSERTKRLTGYLLKRAFPLVDEPGEAFIERQLQTLLA